MPAPFWPEIVVRDAVNARLVQRETATGRLRAFAPGLYSSCIAENDDAVVRRNLWQVVAHLAPGAIISHRTGIELRPAADGTVFLVGDRWLSRDLPGLRLRMQPGPRVQPGDYPYAHGLVIASRPRALLEALKPSRRRGTVVARGLTEAAVAEELEKTFRSGGEAALNRLRDDAKRLAPALGAEEQYAELTALVSVLLGTREGDPHAATARARLAGEPFDVDRVALVERLFARLRQIEPPDWPAERPPSVSFTQASFYDAYFSNFIEGTEFEVAEARAIVFGGHVPEARPADAHDVLGTYAIVGNPQAIMIGLRDLAGFDAFRERIAVVHRTIVARRPEKRPGEFKERGNRAGETRFADPADVLGTLRRGFEIVRALPHPFQRALGVMCLVSEVHPFDDGNGRVARALMNAELVSANETRIIIPTVFRDDYLRGLRNLSRQSDAEVYLQVMAFAQRWVAAIDWADAANAERQLRECHAFEQPAADVRLLMPRS